MSLTFATRLASGADITRRLAIALFVCTLMVNGLLLLLQPVSHNETVLDHTKGLVLGEGGDDSWGVMHVALDQYAAKPETPLYTELFFSRMFRFQYPPSSLFALEALRLAGPNRVRIADNMKFEPWPPINDIVGWLFIVLTAASAAAILELSLHRQRGFVDQPGLGAVRILLVALLTLTFYPVIKAYTLGQIQVWINALFALSLLCWFVGLRGLGGVLIGIVCLIKPHYGLLFLWALLRREWSFFIWGAATVAVGLAASVWVFGFTNHLDYLKVLQFLSQHGEAYYPNHSVNGLLNRLMSLVDPANFVVLDIPAGKFPPFTPWIYGVTLASTIALIVYGLARRSAPHERARDFARAGLCFTLASPIAWEHHYGILLPIFALLVADGRQSRLGLILLAVAYALAANFFSVAQLLAPTVFNPLQSYVLIAALMMLGLLHQNSAEPPSFIYGRGPIGT